jgi:Flp pilus assembly protein TadG
MLTRLKRLATNLRRDASGNTMLLFALGMPVFIGGTGFAVDTSQCYMWKRERQYAVDQAAIAGAWARTNEATMSTYQTRAQQEYNANVSVVADFDTAPSIGLANFSGGTNNSVAVSGSATRQLPFSSFLTGESATITAYAQASFAQGVSFTSCLIAVDEDADGAITLGGSSVLTAGCGMAALSDSDSAITVNGNPDVDAGWILARGGIDDWLSTHTDDEIHEHLSGLYDPFEELSPPNPAESQVARTYACSNGSTSTKADTSTQVQTAYTYWKGANTNSVTAYNYSTPKQNSTTTSSQTNVSVANGTTAGSTSTSNTTWTQLGGSGQNKIWEKKIATTTTSTSNVVVTTVPAGAALQPGTYATINVRCTTTFAPGVYIIDGGELNINAQYQVTGSAVMYVLKNGAGIQINGGADVNLTAIQASDLMARGVSAEEANKLAGMLVFEDRESEGASRNIINGNASTVLNGTIYLPVSNLTFSGTAAVTSQCLMIAANTITLQGNANMTTFCPAGSSEDTTVANEASTVKLVA